MPRDIPVGNGKLLVCFDRLYRIRDVFFPHVGQENHVGGNVFRIGVLVDGVFSWINEEWDIAPAYEPDTMVTRVRLEHAGLELRLNARDTVDFHENLFVRQMEVANRAARPRRVEIFFTQDFDIGANSIGDTAVYDPATGAVVHYKGPRYFLVNACTEQLAGLAQYAVGLKRSGGKEGTFKDAEDGLLSGNPVAQGSVDSVVSLRLDLEAQSSAPLYYWIAAGRTWEEVRRLEALVRHKHPLELLRRTDAYWRLWVRKEPLPVTGLPVTVETLYRRSLLILRTQLDAGGAILAGNDSDVIHFNRDTYSYVWPRDGALVANALDLAGYPMPAQRFYTFIAGLMGKEGYLLHKYNPDGTLASSWHPWYGPEGVQLPIQEDETALVIWALWHHFALYRDIEFIKPLYRPLIKRAADFMATYRDTPTALPGPSYDLWEERRGIPAFTAAAVFGGLTAASLFCQVFGENQGAERYRTAASEIRDAISRHLWLPAAGHWGRALFRSPSGEWAVDSACDASVLGLSAFGVFAPDDPHMAATVQALQRRLWLPGACGGLARYENDPYYRTDPNLPGNPWFVTTLWLADYQIARAQNEPELAPALDILRWVAAHALPSGVLAEQLHPATGRPLSVSPLTWSHATLVATLQHYVRRLLELRGETPPRQADWLSGLFRATCSDIYGRCALS